MRWQCERWAWCSGVVNRQKRGSEHGARGYIRARAHQFRLESLYLCLLRADRAAQLLLLHLRIRLAAAAATGSRRRRCCWRGSGLSSRWRWRWRSDGACRLAVGQRGRNFGLVKHHRWQLLLLRRIEKQVALLALLQCTKERERANTTTTPRHHAVRSSRNAQSIQGMHTAHTHTRTHTLIHES